MILVEVKLKNFYIVKVNHEYEEIDLGDEVAKGEAIKHLLEMELLLMYKL